MEFVGAVLAAGGLDCGGMASGACQGPFVAVGLRSLLGGKRPCNRILGRSLAVGSFLPSSLSPTMPLRSNCGSSLLLGAGRTVLTSRFAPGSSGNSNPGLRAGA